MIITCKKCGKAKKDTDFCKDKSRKSGLHPYCKECNKKRIVLYTALHREEARERSRLWVLNNKERVKEYREDPSVKKHKKTYMKGYRAQNCSSIKEKQKAYDSDRIKKDLSYARAISFRKHLGVALKSNAVNSVIATDIGCSIGKARKHLESLFQTGMTWDNWGRHGWHIDHIRPLSSFNLTIPKQFKEAVHYTNMQPLWAYQNLEKGKHYVHCTTHTKKS